ncbi:hypothetical protein [Leptospira interrogans]|uniref:Lipoprotein n=2 Tax=Leptospira interrogans TaxID=173 RepID=A0AAP9WLM8_LEPIR|nr:hypothetical protein [Leptospira interrogans]EMN70603.1 putative lipoprotein [Leptospira interrogans serovar Bataviae str. UI 08561]QOI50432.1 hypothetical protein Lepto1489_08245 [Leptospira interrogans serovar Bataviae]WOT12046.1 hypothetical protein CFY92_0006115 [Leptospira interrogans]
MKINIIIIIIIFLMLSCMGAYTLKGPILDQELKDVHCDSKWIKDSLVKVKFSDDLYDQPERELLAYETRKSINHIIKTRCNNSKIEAIVKGSNTIEIDFYRFRIKESYRFFILNILSIFIFDLIFKNSLQIEYDIKASINNISNDRNGIKQFSYARKEAFSLFELNIPKQTNIFSVLRSDLSAKIINELGEIR